MLVLQIKSFFILVLVIDCKYHSLSQKSIVPPEGLVDSYFGYTLGYIPNYTVIGAPHADLIGQVYRCDTKQILVNSNKTICEKIEPAPKMMFVERMSHFKYKQRASLWASMSSTHKCFSTCQYYFGECFIFEIGTRNLVGHLDLYKDLDENQRKRGRWVTMIDGKKSDLLVMNFLSDSLKDQLNLEVKAVNNSDLSTLYKVDSWVMKDGFSLMASTSGKFFSDVPFTVYAISTFDENMKGKVQFLKFEPNETSKKSLKVVKEYYSRTFNRMLLGTLFGAVMHAADFNGDDVTELIVSAPAYFTSTSYECGAVYIYIGGTMKDCNTKQRIRNIYSTIDGERFGSALASTDTDGDGIPELFVGAPRVTGSGKVYIFSGAKLRQILQLQSWFEIVHTELKSQVLFGTEYEGFGSSLQVLPDIDDNSCDELLVGAPYKDKAILFRCVPTVNITLTNSIVDYETVPENVTSFNVLVCLDVSYPNKLEEVSTNLIITNNITRKDMGTMYTKGLNLKDEEALYKIELKNKPNINCKNVTIDVKKDDPGRYTFVTVVNVDKDIYKIKEFATSWVEINGTMKKELEITRGCDGNSECVPKLNMSLQWSISNDFRLGSSTSENMTIKVTNDGTSANRVCLKIEPMGLRLLRPLTIYLPKPFTNAASFSEIVPLDLNGTTNEDRTLRVTVTLYKRCDEGPTLKQKLKSDVSIDDTKIEVVGSARNVDVKIIGNSKKDIKPILSEHYYNITNLYNIPWNKLNVEIFVKKEPFLDNYSLHGIDSDDCQNNDENNSIKYSCVLNVKPFKSTKLHISINVIKEIARKAMINGAITIQSRLVLYIDETVPEKKIFVQNQVYFEEIKVYQKKSLMILIFSLFGLLVLAIIIYALYKAGFFVRKEKTKLHELKKEIRRQSVRRNTSVGNESFNGVENLCDMSDDEVFENALNENTKVITFTENDKDMLTTETSF